MDNHYHNHSHGAAAVTCFDQLDSFLTKQALLCQDALPVIQGLDQILASAPAPSPSAYSTSSSDSSSSTSMSSTSEHSRMSPDSTTYHHTPSPSSSGAERTFYPLHHHHHPSPAPHYAQADSTTSGANSHNLSTQPSNKNTTSQQVDYDSDAFNSDDSCSSFAEVEAVHQFAQRLAAQHGQGSAPPSQQNLNLMFPGSGSHEGCLIKKKRKKKVKRAGDTLLKCHMCDYSTRFKEHLTSHMNTHYTDRNYMCSDCGQTFKWSHSLKRHQRTHQVEPDYRYTCNYCFKSFSRKDHLTIHENLHTSSGATYPCQECGATFKNKKTLTGHIKTHSSQKAFKCDQCDSEFTRRASLNRHVRAAHAGQVIKCPECPAVFSYRSTLEDHKKAAHNAGKREFGCQLCGVQFAVKAYLSKHMVTCRNRAMGKSFTCLHCTKCFPTKRHLHEHEKRKHNITTSASDQAANQSPTAPAAASQQLTSPASPAYDPASARKAEMSAALSPQLSKDCGSPSSYQYPASPQSPPSSYGSSYQSATGVPPAPVQPSQQASTESAQNVTYPPPQHYGVSDEEDNIGSLLRLVYHCPDVHQPAVTVDSSGYAATSPNALGHHQNFAYTPSLPSHHSSQQALMGEYPLHVEGLQLDCL